MTSHPDCAGSPGGGVPGGFDVDTDELARIARVLTDAADILRSAEDPDTISAVLATNHAAPVPGRGMGVPGWLPEYDRTWRALRDGVLDAHGHAVATLRDTARTYLDNEARNSALIETAGAPNPDHLRPDVGEASRPSAAAAGDADFPTPTEPAGRAGDRPTRDGGDLDTSVALWRRRRDSASQAAHLLWASLNELRWRGAGAAAFTSWTHTHLRRHAALADDAQAAVTALTRTDLAAPGSTRSPTPLPLGPALAIPPSPVPPGDMPRPIASADAPAGSAPGRPVPAPIDVAPDSTSTPNPTATAPTSVSPADSSLSATSSADADDMDVEGLEPPSTPHVPHETVDPHTVEPHSADPATADRATADADSAAQGSGQRAADGDGPYGHDQGDLYGAARDDVPAAGAATLPTAAAAHAALFARSDLAHHVIRDIPLAPAASGLTPDPGDGSEPRRDPGPRGHTAPTAAGPTTADGPPPLWQARPPLHEPSAAVWINLARAADPPAWIDLATTRGLGLDGPGAPDITRTLRRRLHDHHPQTLIIATDDLARRILGHPHRPEVRDTEEPGVTVVDDPRQGLQAAWDETERRRTVGLHAAPVVLLAPAPTTVSARSDLTRTLHHFPPAAFLAVLIGYWNPGTTLTITDHHHISHHHRSDHHRPAPGQPPLTGARLEPTTLDTVHTPPPAPAPDQPDTSDHPDVESDGPPAPDETGERTALALSVLGPVELRYRRPTTPPTTSHTVEEPSEEVLTVPGISSPARELLAYLAAHPGGATRDTIIEALWPDSTADRPDTAFHTTISRLRKRLRDTTGTDTTADLITATDGRWHLNRNIVTVDYWTFLETHPRNPDPKLRRRDHHTAIGLYHGPFAADSIGEWTHTIREATRRRYLEALNDLTQTETPTNPDLALDLLERARNLEPLNEAIYRNIIRIHLNHHRHDAARSTYELLRAHLATIEATPNRETERLAVALMN